jgi:hypothetical protein
MLNRYHEELHTETFYLNLEVVSLAASKNQA